MNKILTAFLVICALFACTYATTDSGRLDVSGFGQCGLDGGNAGDAGGEAGQSGDGSAPSPAAFVVFSSGASNASGVAIWSGSAYQPPAGLISRYMRWIGNNSQGPLLEYPLGPVLTGSPAVLHYGEELQIAADLATYGIRFYLSRASQGNTPCKCFFDAAHAGCNNTNLNYSSGVNAALSDLAAHIPAGVPIINDWWEGEYEATNGGVTPDSYLQCLRDQEATVMRLLPGHPVYTVTHLLNMNLGSSYPNKQLVRDADTAFVAESPSTRALISSDDMIPASSPHFNGPQYNAIGDRTFASIRTWLFGG